jgi:sec-independent protein translocase protein TatB
MFDLDASKIIMVGVVALVVVGPKDLPRFLRGVARILGKMRRMRSEVQNQVTQLMKEVDPDAIERSAAIDIAVDPRTAMRGYLPSATELRTHTADPPETIYASPEMREYLAPLPDAGPVADAPSAIQAELPAKTPAAEGSHESIQATLTPSAA